MHVISVCSVCVCNVCSEIRHLTSISNSCHHRCRRKRQSFKLKALSRLDSTSVEREQLPSIVLRVSQMSLRSVSMELKEEELEGNHLVISCTINKNSSNNVPIHALIDCGATGYAFVDDEFAHYHSLPRYRLKTERELGVIDGRPIKSGNITHMTKISLSFNGHEERLLACNAAIIAGVI